MVSNKPSCVTDSENSTSRAFFNTGKKTLQGLLLALIPCNRCNIPRARVRARLKKLNVPFLWVKKCFACGGIPIRVLTPKKPLFAHNVRTAYTYHTYIVRIRIYCGPN